MAGFENSEYNDLEQIPPGIFLQRLMIFPVLYKFSIRGKILINKYQIGSEHHIYNVIMG